MCIIICRTFYVMRLAMSFKKKKKNTTKMRIHAYTYAVGTYMAMRVYIVHQLM